MKNRKTPKHISITVLDVTYNDIRSAWREVSPDNLPEITVRKRLAAGWPPNFAFILPPIDPANRRRGWESSVQSIVSRVNIVL